MARYLGQLQSSDELVLLPQSFPTKSTAPMVPYFASNLWSNQSAAVCTAGIKAFVLPSHSSTHVGGVGDGCRTRGDFACSLYAVGTPCVAAKKMKTS